MDFIKEETFDRLPQSLYTGNEDHESERKRKACRIFGKNRPQLSAYEQIVNGTRLMQAVAATKELAGYLQIPVGHPLMLVEQIAYDDHDRCVDYAHLWLRSDLFHVTVNMGRSPQRTV